MNSAAQLLQGAIAKHRAGDHFAAETDYRQHLREHPNDPSGLHFLGLLRTHQDRYDEAVKLMVAALEVDPTYVDAWSNLSVAYFRQRDLQRAEFCARKALELAPGFANAWANLGMTLRARNALEEALLAWGKALDLQPGMRNVAISYGHLLYRLDRRADALEFYGRWLSSMPDDPIPRHMLAALGGAERPLRASDGYLRATFDDFADCFDRNLEELGYRAPQLLLDAVLECSALPQIDRLAVLDLGCGTGLCGPLWRSRARRLVGLDLSPNMLSKAALRAIYDQLNCAELTRWLAECETTFDLALAADVLCYFGDLREAFTNVRRVLRVGGVFACSLEELAAATPTPEGFILQPHGRYQHTREYVGRTLLEAGLQLVRLGSGTLRHEREDEVRGILVIARNPSNSAAAVGYASCYSH